MKKVAQVYKSTGEIIGIVNLYNDYSPSMEEVISGHIFIEVEKDINEKTFQKTKYWKDNSWHTRDVRPGFYYKWKNYTWEKDLTALWDDIKRKIDLQLLYSDWTQASDNNLTSEQRADWKTYRDSLRDITTTYASAESWEDITWPEAPEDI